MNDETTQKPPEGFDLKAEREGEGSDAVYERPEDLIADGEAVSPADADAEDGNAADNDDDAAEETET